MQTVEKLRRIFFIGAIVSCISLISSGVFVLVTYASRNSNNMYNQIVISDEFQSNTIVFEHNEMNAGDSIELQMNISSQLVERVKYSISFTNHNSSELDTYLYVSVNSQGEEPLINNTLKQISENGYGIFNKVLDSMGSKAFTFTFSISELLSEEASYDFDINFKAEGKIIY